MQLKDTTLCSLTFTSKLYGGKHLLHTVHICGQDLDIAANWYDFGEQYASLTPSLHIIRGNNQQGLPHLRAFFAVLATVAGKRVQPAEFCQLLRSHGAREEQS